MVLTSCLFQLQALIAALFFGLEFLEGIPTRSRSFWINVLLCLCFRGSFFRVYLRSIFSLMHFADHGLLKSVAGDSAAVLALADGAYGRSSLVDVLKFQRPSPLRKNGEQLTVRFSSLHVSCWF